MWLRHQTVGPDRTSFLVLLLLLPTWSLAQVNSWLKPSSGSWEEMQWSLGILPSPGQAIVITNAGWKAVMISPNTSENYPDSLSVDSITIASPTNSNNVLLLNYAGLQLPLTVNSLTVASNA